MSCFKLHITRFIVLLLALQILNLSVQSRPASASLTLSHTAIANPVDHLIEYVVERIMKKKDAFPEDGKQHRRDPMQFNKTASFHLYLAYYTIQISHISHHSIVMHRDVYQEGYRYLFASEINPPPPKA